MTDELTIKLLGGFELDGGSSCATRAPSRKARAVLACLALQPGRMVPREKLTALFWPDSPERLARANLRQLLTVLRKRLGRALVTEADGIGLDGSGLDLDTARFEDCLARDDLAALTEATAIYAGDLLDGFNIKEDAFESWLAPLREHYRSQMIGCLTKLIGCYRESREPNHLLGTAHRLLALDPTNEEAHRAAMQAYAALGRHSEALLQFERCRDTLRQHLGVPPQPQTLRLFEELRAHRGRRRAPGSNARPDGADALGPDAAEPASMAIDLSLPDEPSVAVLPFKDLSDRPGQDYFAEGIAEDILTELSRFPDLFVSARQSSFSYKGSSADLERIARQLGVRYILDGSIRRAESRIRLNARLADIETGRLIWTERYDCELTNILDLQDEITRNVVAAMAPQIEIAEMARAQRTPIADASSYDLALKARAQLDEALRMANAEALDTSIRTARESLAKEPRNVRGLGTLAFALTYKHINGWERVKGESLKLAWQAVDRLFTIEPESPLGYTLRGHIRVFRGEHDAALSDFRRAQELNPNSTWNLFWMACAEATSGLTRDAREHAERGLRLSPRDMDIGLGIAHIALFEASFVDGDFRTAKEWGARAIQLQAKAPWRQSLMVACCGHLGDLDEAARHVAEINSFAPHFLPSLCRGELSWFKKPEHAALLMEGLRKAGLDVTSSDAAVSG